MRKTLQTKDVKLKNKDQYVTISAKEYHTWRSYGAVLMTSVAAVYHIWLLRKMTEYFG